MRTIKPTWHRPRVGRIAGMILGSASGVLLLLSIFAKDFEQISFDLPFRLFRHGQGDTNVVIIQMDETSYAKLNQNPCSFDGALHAKLIDRLASEGVKEIVFDIVFVDTNPPPPGDKELAAAMRKHGRVVVANDLKLSNVGGGVLREPLTIRSDIEEAAAGWGIAILDDSHSVQRHVEHSGPIPSLAWKVAEIRQAPVTLNPSRRMEPRWLNYYGPNQFPKIPYFQAIDRDYKVPTDLKGRTAFIGRSERVDYARAEKDRFADPWTPITGYSPFGLEFHALTYVNLVRGDWLRRLPIIVEVILLALFGAACGYALPAMKPLGATLAAVIAALVTVGVCAYSQLALRAWFPWLIPVAVQIPLALGWAVLFGLIRSQFEAEFLKRSLALYLSPPQVEEILQHPELVKPGVQQREISILFSDIENFSKISERMLHHDLAALLNDYYETAIGSVHEAGGTVVSIIGDAILAVWNAPQPQADHCQRALRAGASLTMKLVEFDKTRKGLRLKTRVGLHSGSASVGNIGSTTHFDYTVVGENVNLASRLEGLNKFLGTSILATRQIQQHIETKMPSRTVGHFRFKGLDQVIEVYELISSPDVKIGDEWLIEFTEGIHNFQRAAFDQAIRHFNNVLASRPGDGPSLYYIQKATDLKKSGVASGWIGEIDLTEK